MQVVWVKIGDFRQIIGYMGLWDDGSNSQPADVKTILRKERGQGHVTHFRILHPLKYIWNG